MPASDAYYDSLFGPEVGMAPVVGGAPGGGGFLGKLKTGISKNKGAVGSILGYLLLNKILEARGLRADQNVQKEGLQAQADLATPENLYYQAAQPQAREEASMAKRALLAHISGGVLGPSLATGERRIGG